MNAINKIFTDMTDLELAQAIQEIKENDSYAENSIVKQKCKEVHNIIGGTVYEHMMNVYMSILKECALRFTPNVIDLSSSNDAISFRTRALNWWNHEINGTELQKELADKFCQTRVLSITHVPLTGREIEQIYTKYKNEN